MAYGKPEITHEEGRGSHQRTETRLFRRGEQAQGCRAAAYIDFLGQTDGITIDMGSPGVLTYDFC